jgi:hypothetical protein
MSVPVEAVVQVRCPTGDGVVIFMFFENTVPFVVPEIASTSREPAAVTTTSSVASSVQDWNVRVLIGPPTLAPVNGLLVVTFIDDTVHVFRKIPNVSVQSDEPERLALIVTAWFCVTPPTSSVVAEAVLANAIRASAVAATTPKFLIVFITLSLKIYLGSGERSHPSS